MKRQHSSFKALALLYSLIVTRVLFSSSFAQGAPGSPEMMMGSPVDVMGAPADQMGFPQEQLPMALPEATQQLPMGLPDASGQLPMGLTDTSQGGFAPATSQVSTQAYATPDMSQSSGPETVALPEEKVGVQGNWMKKREWLLKTNDANNQIQELVLSINGTRKTYNEKYRSIDEILDEFYKQLGQEQGKLQEIFEGTTRYLEKKKKAEIGSLSSESGEEKDKSLQNKIELIEQQINTLKEMLEQLKLDMQSIEDLDRSITERMKKLDEQINIANDEAANAQKMTNDLWYIIDDKKARAYYYEIKGSSLEKIKVIDAYLNGDLMTDFDSVIDTIKTNIAKAQDDIKALEDKGLIIKNRAHRVEKLKLKDIEDLELKRKEEEFAQRKASTAAAQRVKKPSTWYGQIYHFFADLGESIIDFFSSLYKQIFGGTKQVKPRPKLEAKMPLQIQVTKADSSPSAVQTTQPAPSSPQTMLPEALPPTVSQPQVPVQMPTT